MNADYGNYPEYVKHGSLDVSGLSVVWIFSDISKLYGLSKTIIIPESGLCGIRVVRNNRIIYISLLYDIRIIRDIMIFRAIWIIRDFWLYDVPGLSEMSVLSGLPTLSKISWLYKTWISHPDYRGYRITQTLLLAVEDNPTSISRV
jgi:hypothetical protein